MSNISYRDWADKLIERQQTLMNVAIETQLKTYTFHIEQFNQRHKEITEFPINSYVLQNYETEGQKPPNNLSTVLRGPHKIVGKYTRPEGPDIKIVQDLTTNKLEDFKVNDLEHLGSITLEQIHKK